MYFCEITQARDKRWKLFLGETELENNVKMSCRNLFTSTNSMYFRYFCLECQLLFPDDAAYLQHKRTTHSTMGAPMTCWDCGETFTYYVDLSQVTHTWCGTFIKVKENIPILPIGILDFCRQNLAAPYLEPIGHQVFTINYGDWAGKSDVIVENAESIKVVLKMFWTMRKRTRTRRTWTKLNNCPLSESFRIIFHR